MELVVMMTKSRLGVQCMKHLMGKQ